MAVEFICSDCGGDGTRCRCHEKREGGWVFEDPKEELEKRKLEIKIEQEECFRELKKLK